MLTNAAKQLPAASPRFAAMLLALAWLLLGAGPTHAHSVGTSFVRLETDTSKDVRTRVDLGLRDLEFAVGLDANDDGRITWGELHANGATLGAYIDSQLQVSRGAQPCKFVPPDVTVETRDDEVFAVLTTTAICTTDGALGLESNLFFDIDDSHRTLVTASGSESAVTVLTHTTRSWTLEPQSGAWNSFTRFVGQGIWHIWIGFDHLAFLLLLLLPLLRRQADDRPAHAIKRILKVVTAFTVAHSMTLLCAALGYVDLPSRWIEASIAASIVIAAIANLSNAAARFGIAMAFGFGLIHGLGFAGALADLVSDTSMRIVPLLGFNLGVELGQLVVVAVVFPALFLSRSVIQYRERTVMAGSLVMGALGVAWLVERTVLT